MSNAGAVAPSEPYDLTPTQAGEILEVHWATVNRWADHGRIPCRKTPGGWRRYRRSDIEAFAQSLTREAAS